MKAWLILNGTKIVMTIVGGAGVIIVSYYLRKVLTGQDVIKTGASDGRKVLHTKIDKNNDKLIEKFDDLVKEQNDLNKSVAGLQAQHCINHPGQQLQNGL